MNKDFSKEEGFTQVLLALVVVLAIGAIASASVPVKRSYGSGMSNVEGVSTLAGHTTQGSPEVKIVNSSGATALVAGDAGAVSAFPLSINQSNDSVEVTTPQGSQTVAVLPSQAIKNLVTGGVLNDVTSVAENNSLASINRLVTLEDNSGVLGYSVQGQKKHLLFGAIPLKTNVSAFVSAQNGQVVESQTSLMGRILDKIAP